MKILVTGAAGFIGSHLVTALLSKNYNVSIIVRESTDLSSIKNIIKKINVYTFDGTENSMLNIIIDSSPDVVCHLAGISKYKHESGDIKKMIESNILFGTYLIDAMVKNKVLNFINTGTYWQHFDGIKYNPSCLYAATKQSFDDILKYYIESSNLNVINLKLYDNYGPNDRRLKLFKYIDQCVINNEVIKLSPGKQLIDIIYISDLVAAYIVSIETLQRNQKFRYKEYFISSQKKISLKKLVKKYLKITGQKARIDFGAKEYRDREIMKPFSSKKNLPGWKPKINLDDGLKKLIEK